MLSLPLVPARRGPAVSLQRLAEEAAHARDLVRWDDFHRGQDDCFCRQADTWLRQASAQLTPATIDTGGTNNASCGKAAGGYADQAKQQLGRAEAHDAAWSAIAGEVSRIEADLAALQPDQFESPDLYARLTACGGQLQADLDWALETNGGVDGSMKHVCGDFDQARKQIKAVASDAKDVNVSGNAQSARELIGQTENDLGSHTFLLSAGAVPRKSLAETLANLETLASGQPAHVWSPDSSPENGKGDEPAPPRQHSS